MHSILICSISNSGEWEEQFETLPFVTEALDPGKSIGIFIEHSDNYISSQIMNLGKMPLKLCSLTLHMPHRCASVAHHLWPHHPNTRPYTLCSLCLFAFMIKHRNIWRAPAIWSPFSHTEKAIHMHMLHLSHTQQIITHVFVRKKQFSWVLWSKNQCCLCLWLER